jgi:hypothetical protein
MLPRLFGLADGGEPGPIRHESERPRPAVAAYLSREMDHFVGSNAPAVLKRNSGIVQFCRFG